MGAWGPAIFSDDTAADVRGDYRELLEDQVPDDEATRRVVAEYQYLSPDQAHVLWLALAAAQHQVGRLDDEVKRRALAVIDSGEGLELWAEAGPPELASRRAALAKLREQLTGPQPAPKTLRRPWRHVTDLSPGMVLARTGAPGATALFRVLHVVDSRVGVAPTLERLDWAGRKVPSARKLGKLTARVVHDPPLPPIPERYQVWRYRKEGMDWPGAGLAVVATLPPRPGDATADVRMSLQWSGLAMDLDKELGPPA